MNPLVRAGLLSGLAFMPATGVFADVVDLPGSSAPLELYTNGAGGGGAAWISSYQMATRRVTRMAPGDGDLGPAFALATGQVLAAGTDDGGVVLRTTGARCTIERRDAAFALVWRVRLAEACLEEVYGPLVVASGPNVWAWVGTRLLAIDIDGETGWSAPLPSRGAYVALQPAPDGDVVLVEPGNSDDAAIRVTRLAGDGRVRWSVSPGGGRNAVLQTAATADAVFVRALREDGTYLATSLRFGSGSTEFAAIGERGRANDLAIDATRAWVFDRTTPPHVVRSFARAGGASESVELPPDVTCEYRCPLLPLTDGSLLVLAPAADAASNSSRAFRIAPNGATFQAQALTGRVNSAARRGDGTYVLAFRASGGLDWRLATVSRDGAIAFVTLPVAPVSAGLVRAAAFAPDGAYATVQFDDTRSLDVLSVADRDGAVRWSNGAAQSFAIALALGPMGACMATTLPFPQPGISVACRDATTGALRWERRYEDGGWRQDIRLRQLDDGTLLVVATGDAGPARGTILRYSAAGALLSRSETPLFPEAISGAGDVLAFRATGYVALAPTGAVRFELPRVPGTNPLAALGEGDSVAMLFAQSSLPSSPLVLRQYNPNGILRSEATLDQVLPGVFPVLVTGRDSAVVVDESSSGTRIQYVDAAVGTLRWTRTLPPSPRVFFLESGDIALLTRFGDRLRFDVLGASDGRTLVSTEESCASCGERLFVDTRGSGMVRAISSAPFVPSLQPSRLHTFATSEARLAIDPRSISGGWYPEYFPGEGLVATVDTSSNTFFAAWFTYASPFVEGIAGQRWLSLQGDASASGTSQLRIYENRGGSFAQPPATTAVAIGRATLRLVACDRAELDYEFDGNPVVSGRRTLTRLTDPGHCGTTPPAPRDGVDWRQSGGWFSPATAGQGVLFSIAPDAPVFGAWFTYDVAGVADDPRSQLWLTLQSAAAPATGSDIELDVYRTIGGEFDRLPSAFTRRIGTARLTLDGCSRATLRWQFDASASAGVLSGRAGEQSLERLGACPP